MLYVALQDDIIKGIYCSVSKKQVQSQCKDFDIIEVPETFSGRDGESMALFDSEFNRIPIIEKEEEEESETVVNQE